MSMSLNGKSAIKYLLLWGLVFIAPSAWAKDLFVATTGNDSVSYASNSISSPWGTPKFAWENAKAGDTVYFRGGTYNISTQINTKFVGNDGTVTSPITFKNYNNETVVFTSTLTIVFSIQKNYNYIEGIICDGLGLGGSIAWWKVGEDISATNFKATRMIAKNMGAGSDNQGFIYLNSALANNAIIEYNTITGPGPSGHHNSSGIIIFRSQGVKIRNNEISNFPNGIYYKHSNSLSDSGIEISYNYIRDCGNSGIQSITNYGYYHDNILINCSLIFGVDGGMGDGYVGADYNTISHNTFYGGAVTLKYETNDADPNKGCLYNVVKDNISMVTAEWHRYTSLPHYTTSDHNIFAPATVAIENRINYGLEPWKSHTGGDAHSVSGTPTFVKTNPFAIADFILTASSLGKNAASDGKDMGADICKVGVNPSCSDSTTDQIAPSSPSGLVVQ